MSVVPRDDNLVMSFSEATRVFNHDQYNSGSFVPGTGDASHKAPYGSGERRLPPPVPMTVVDHEGLHEPEPIVGTTGAGHPRNEDDNCAHDVAQGTAGVVPASVPSRRHVRDHPHRMLRIRHRQRDVQITDGEFEYWNPWFKIRSRMRIYFAEFLGTMVLVLWGEGTQAQVIAARNAPNDYLSIAWGWGVGFMLAVYISSGISGGHINPAVTISLAIFRKFKWRRVPGYILAQLLGAFTAAAILYGVYYDPLKELNDGYAQVLTTGPAAKVPTVVGSFFSVFIGAALLMGAIASFTDTGNNPATPGLTPLLLGLIMVGIASAFGYQTGFVLNPARDLGPRLLVWATGIPGKALWLNNTAYGIWTPTVGAVTGAIVGNFLYDLLIYHGRDSPLNANFSRAARKREKEFRRQQEHGEGEKDVEAAGANPGAAIPVHSGIDRPRNSDSTLNDHATVGVVKPKPVA